MSPEAQRIAIAQACGITEIYAISVPIPGSFNESRDVLFGRRSGFGIDVPDYPNDLNAMHEAEKTLVTTGRWIEYAQCLAKLTYVNKTVWETSVRYSNGDINAVFHDLSSIVRATAAQRAEAFLWAVSKWEGAK